MEVKDYLSNKGITFKEFKHPAVFTCEDVEGLEECKGIRGVHSKNLFLKDRKSRNFYLVIMPAEKKLELGKLEELFGEKIKFANPADLKSILGLEPGSVSPFGLINDVEAKVKLVVDKDIWGSEFVSFHPNINTATLELAQQEFRKYLDSLKNEKKVVAL